MFEWDEAKNAANIVKHGIDFADAKRIFEGPVLTRIDERFDYGEVRMLSLGAIEGRVLLAVVHTARDGSVRLISARFANRKETSDYAQALRSSPDAR